MANRSVVLSQSDDEEPDSARVPTIPPTGPRKLIRPSLSPSLLNRRPFPRRETPLFAHQHPELNGKAHAASSHAEAFYFQKQMQAQTLMVFVLEDGDRVTGSIEWYDTDTIKVRHGNVRTLIYKSSIKYLHKANEPQP